VAGEWHAKVYNQSSKGPNSFLLTFGCDIQFLPDFWSSLGDEFTKNPLRLSFPIDLAGTSAENRAMPIRILTQYHRM
jgi:hypothetical protein